MITGGSASTLYTALDKGAGGGAGVTAGTGKRLGGRWGENLRRPVPSDSDFARHSDGLLGCHGCRADLLRICRSYFSEAMIGGELARSAKEGTVKVFRVPAMRATEGGAVGMAGKVFKALSMRIAGRRAGVIADDAFNAFNVTGAGGGAGGIAGEAVEAPNIRGTGGGAGREAGKTFEAPNMKGAGGGAGGIVDITLAAPNMKGAG